MDIKTTYYLSKKIKIIRMLLCKNGYYYIIYPN